MKNIILPALLAASFCLAGCESTVVDRRPIVRGPGYGYRGGPDVAVVRTYDGGYYRPQNNRTIVVDETRVHDRNVYVNEGRNVPRRGDDRSRVVVKKKKKKNDRRDDHRDDRHDDNRG